MFRQAKQTNVFIILIIILASVHTYSVDLKSSDPVQGLALGVDHTCVSIYNKVKCWGDDDHGYLDVPEGLNNVVQISAGAGHTCVLDKVRGVVCWGQDDYRQLSPPSDLVNPQIIGSGAFHSCAVTEGRVKCWGSNHYGQLNVPSDLQNVVELAVGRTHACAITDSKDIVCWGYSGGSDRRLTPPTGLKNPRQIRSHGYHSCVNSDDGFFCWGSNEYGESRISKRYNSKPSMVVPGVRNSCALFEGQVECWGNNGSGELEIPDGLDQVLQVAIGDHHVCASTQKSIRCWGYNGFGEVINIDF